MHANIDNDAVANLSCAHAGRLEVCCGLAGNTWPHGGPQGAPQVAPELLDVQHFCRFAQRRLNDSYRQTYVVVATTPIVSQPIGPGRLTRLMIDIPGGWLNVLAIQSDIALALGLRRHCCGARSRLEVS